jgi:hypothetical protein
VEGIFIFAGLFVGGIVTFFVTKRHYKQLRKGLESELAKLRHLNIRLLLSMEQAGLIKWNRDSEGNIIGFHTNPKSPSKVPEEPTKDRILH